MRLDTALVARMDVAPDPGAPDAGPWCNEAVGATSDLPADARAVIHCPAPSVTTAGRHRAAGWVLEFEPRAKPFIEPLMGWTGGSDPLRQVRLRFSSRDAAIRYARQHGLAYEVREPVHSRCDALAHAQPHAPAIEQGAPVLEYTMPLEIAWAWEAPHLALDMLHINNDTGGKIAA
jgi:NADH dehydrogenase ubiquinone Fe-S protein 4